MTQKMQVLCGLQVLFLLFNCQTPGTVAEDSMKDDGVAGDAGEALKDGAENLGDDIEDGVERAGDSIKDNAENATENR